MQPRVKSTAPHLSVRVYERPGSPYWWATVYLPGEGGRKRRFSTGVVIGTNRRLSARAGEDAARERAHALAASVAESVPPVEDRASFGAVARRLIEGKQADGMRVRGIEGLAWYLDAHVVPYFGTGRDVRTIRRSDLEAFKAHLRQSYAAQTVNNALSAARQVLKHACFVDELLEFVPAVKNVRRDQTPHGRALTVEQAEALIAAVDPRAVEARHFLGFIANTGLRKSEALAVRFSWVDWERGVVAFPSEYHKGGRPRPPVVLNAAALTVLRERLALHASRKDPTDDRVFRQKKHDVARNGAAERLGLGRVRNHDLRHTHASLLLDSGASPVDVRDTLGHASLQMIGETYGHAYLDSRKASAAKVEIRAPKSKHGLTP